MPIRTLLVDDDPYARASVRTLLSQEPGVEVVGECADGVAALEAIGREDPDLVFLDVDMPELDGFGVLEALGDARMPAVVFVTAHEEHAIRAFEVHALDYVVKPFGMERFRRAFARAREAIAERDEPRVERIQALLEQLREEQRGLERILSGPVQYLERLMVKTGNRVLLLPTRDIDYVEAEGNYVKLHSGRAGYLVRWKIGALEERLDPRHFARIHRSTIVNLDRVKELRPWFAGDFIVALKDGTELKLSRGYRPRLEEQLGAAG
ncbi:MAG TPA: LytTR family DNA-binding domain-containing protein [Longimicrobiaceae bacterium]|nr:LytTR family DNA-binding domain-containing protein [Longimicrobiaceae bacterium]